MFSPSAHRNKDVILQILKKYATADHGTVLEIASGSGQHVCYFAEQIENYIWQPSDCNQQYISSINTHIRNSKVDNVRDPVFVDITKHPDTWNNGSFKNNSFDIILNVNMMHISPIECTQGLFLAANKLLVKSGKLITYGPYSVNGILSPESNVRFDESLRIEDPAWGIRDIAQLEEFAANNTLKLSQVFDMPANNQCLVFVKE